MGSYNTLKELDRKTRKGVQGALFQDEVFLGAIDCRDSLFASRRTKLILTDQRILTFKRGFLRQKTKDYDRNRISNIEFSKGILSRKISLNGSGFTESWYVDYSTGQQFATAARSKSKQRVITEDNEAEENMQATKRGGKAQLAETEPELLDSEEAKEEAWRDDFHYGAAAALGLTIIGGAVGVSQLLTLGLLAVPVFLFLDIRYIRLVSLWKPNTILYVLGGLFLAIVTVPLYLYRRNKTIGL